MTTKTPKPDVLHYSPFSSTPDGRNHAGVVLDAH